MKIIIKHNSVTATNIYNINFSISWKFLSNLLLKIPFLEYSLIKIGITRSHAVSKNHNVKVGLSPSKQNYFYLLQWKHFKNDGKWFLFHLKSSSRSLDIKIFVLKFWPCRKNVLIRKIKFISKFITSQPGYQRITIHILPNISWSKGNQTLKFGQVSI